MRASHRQEIPDSQDFDSEFVEEVHSGGRASLDRDGNRASHPRSSDKPLDEAVLLALSKKRHRERKIIPDTDDSDSDQPAEPDDVDFSGIEHAASHGMPPHFSLLSNAEMSEVLFSSNQMKARYDEDRAVNEPFVSGQKWLFSLSLTRLHSITYEDSRRH